MPLLVACANSNDSSAPATGPSAPSASSPAVAGGASSIPADLCSTLIEGKVDDVIGKPITLSVGPSGDCEFVQDDARALQGSFGEVDHAVENGGYDSYVAGIEAASDKVDKVPIAGLGEQAVVFTGLAKMGSGDSFMAGGVIDLGAYLLHLTLVQGKGMARAHLAATAEGLLRAIDASSR